MHGAARLEKTNKAFRKLPYKIGVSSMVFGHDMVENARVLSQVVDHVEIVLFHTPTLHNIPGREEIRRLNEIRRQCGVTYSVHLPASLEIGAPCGRRRKDDVRLTRDVCLETAELNPVHYILHVPFSPPTLAPVPGLYFKSIKAGKWEDWTKRSLESLARIREEVPETSRFLVENINYSPCFLGPFVESGLCGLCLDIGHLVLGDEDVGAILAETLPLIEEIHIHGVKGSVDHLSVAELPETMLAHCFQCLDGHGFAGVVNMEVFTPEDLSGSIDAILRTLDAMQGSGPPV